jgi:hypothetical protein
MRVTIEASPDRLFKVNKQKDDNERETLDLNRSCD